MDLAQDFPVWGQLTPGQQQKLRESAVCRRLPKGTVISRGGDDCVGLLLVHSGQLRAYILSEQGREITIYRLSALDICLFSAACVMRSIQFEITVEAEKDTEAWMIPANVYKSLMEESLAVANYTNEVMASRFSEVMWLIEQIMWKSFDKRLAGFLLEESALEGSMQLHLTHETIGNHLGAAREMVTRMLRYFQSEGLVRLGRGLIEIADAAGLEKLRDQ